MNEAKRNLIKRLANEAFDAAERYKSLGMLNTSGLSYEERKKQSEDYAIARAEMLEADRKLGAAMDTDMAVFQCLNRLPSDFEKAAYSNGS